MKSERFVIFILTTLGVTAANNPSQRRVVVIDDGLDASETNGVRNLGTGGSEIIKKPKDDSKKEKLPKKDSISNKEKKVKKGKSTGKGKGTNEGEGKGKGSSGDGDTNKKGKGMSSSNGMMGKGKTSLPVAIETTTPSTPTATPIAIPSTPTSPIPSPNPLSGAPNVLETDSPVISLAPAPIALVTNTPSVTVAPYATTDSPVTLLPSVQPIFVAPTDFVFIGISNIVVRYESSDRNTSSVVSMNETIAAIDLTCDYMRNEAIVPLGALEFACIWFLPEFEENNSTSFPVDITYAGTAAFLSNIMNVTEEILDASIMNVLTPPLVQNLTKTINTVLSMENPFQQTTAIFAVV